MFKIKKSWKDKNFNLKLAYSRYGLYYRDPIDCSIST